VSAAWLRTFAAPLLRLLMQSFASLFRLPALLAGIFTLGLTSVFGASYISLESTDIPVSTTAGADGHGSVAMRADGTGFVVVFEAPDASGKGVFFKRYDANWQLVQGPVAVNTFTTNDQRFPTVGMDAAGNFVIAWDSQNQVSGSSGRDIYARRFLADGTAIDASGFLVNSVTTNDQQKPDVAVNASGQFVVTWYGGAFLTEDVFAHGYASVTGTLTTSFSDVTINNTASSPDDQVYPAVAIDTAGNFVVTYQTFGQDVASSYAIYARRMNANGTANGAEFLVNTVTAGDQQHPDIAMDGSGNFNIVWDSPNVDGSGTAIVMQRYDAAGVAQGGNTLVNSTWIKLNNQFNPHIACGGDRIVVTWTTEEPDLDGVGTDVFFTAYNASGTMVYGNWMVSSTTSSNNAVEDNANLAANSAGDFVVLFDSLTSGNSDTYLRRFGEDPDVAFATSTSSGSESTNASINLTRTGAPYVLGNVATDVLVNRTGGTATPTTDFTTTFPAIVTFPANGSTSQTLTIAVVDDTASETNETIDFLLGTVNNGSVAVPTSATYTILDNDRTLSVNDPTIAEGDAGTRNLTFTVSLDAPSNQTVTVNYATANGTATAGSDYVAASGTLTFTPGVTTQTAVITVNGDTLFEANETILLNLSGPTNATIIDGQGLGTLTDDDAPASIAVVSGNNQSTVVNTAFAAPLVALVRNAAGNPVQGVTVTFTAPGSGASVGLANSSPFTNASGQVSTGTATANGIAGGPYTVTAQATGGVAPSTSFSLTNLPPTQLSINDPSVTEGDSGTKTLTFTVTATPVNDFATVSVNWATANGTATGLDGDYVPASGTLTFAPGVATQTISVTVNGDAWFEDNETFFVNLSSSFNAGISDGQGVGTITNDDPEPTLSIGDVTQAEGDAGTTAFTFTVTLTGLSPQLVTVNYVTANGTAAAGSDYQSTSGALVFGPGETTQTMTVQVAGDTIFEADQTFFVNLSNPENATITDSQGVGTITNDDAAPTLTINDVSASEAAGTMTFTATRTGATEVPISVNYATADGTAVSTAGGPGTPDYAVTSGMLSFAPSLAATATQTFTVSLSNDGVYEAAEQFAVNLSDPTGATIADGQGVGTISNDDAAPTLTINDVTVSENSTCTFTVTLTGATALPIAVSYATADGTAVSTANATPGTPDYTATSGTLTFSPSAAGTQTLTLTIPLTDDTTNEPTEQFAVNLSGPTNGATIADAQGIGTLTDDDSVPGLSIDDVTVAEGNAGTTPFTFTITLSTAGAQIVTVNYATADDTALAGSDYAAASGTLTFAPGETTKTLSVLVNGDTTVEPTEQFFVTLSAPTNATIADGQGVGTITSDDLPVVTTNSTVIAPAATTLTINGSNFDPTAANNTVAFNLGAAGTVTAATATSLTVTFSTAPTGGGVLTAVVTTNNVSSGTPVQVATVNSAPVAQDDVAYVQKKQAVDIDVLANDSDSAGDTLTITAVSTPAHGTATIIANGQKIRYEVTEAKITPDSFTYTITDSYGATAMANVSVSDQLPAQAGTYNGLIQPANGAGSGNAQVGLAKITINATTGKFTAGLKLAGQSFTATGVFGTDGAAKFGKTGTADFALKRKGASELRLTLQVGLDALVDTIEGTLTDAGAPFAQLIADRALYTAKKNPVAPYQPVPPELLGKYTVRFAALTAPNQNYQTTEYPQGDGVGVLSVSTSGVAKLTGTLANGTSFSYANALSLGKRWPFYIPLVKGAGSVGGYVTFSEDANTHSDLHGFGLQWYLPANPKSVRYPSGWADGIAVDLLGSTLTVPSVKSGLSVLDAGSAQPTGNVSLRLKGGGLSGAGVEQAFNLTAKATAVAVQPNPTQATLSVPRTGYFSGTFRFPDTNKAGKYKGIIFQGDTAGYGFFLGATESGSVSLVAP